ncbi:PqiC family protein [Pseudohaliea sp.]|uniref:PqiC family protein n=1 Tax=Pseudohaliea sp. TaxID=2740289 RepID=UPI0032F0833A
MKPSPRRLLAPLLALLLATGCASQVELRYVTLAPAGPPAARGAGPGLAVGPVTLPDYLMRGDLAERIDAHRISYRRDRRWAEPLDHGIQRVLVANLAARLDSAAVRGFPGPGPAADTRVDLVVHRFEAEAGVAIAIVDWTLHGSAGEGDLARGTFDAREPLADERAVTQAAALSGLLSLLAADIAAAVTAAAR